MPMHKDIWKDNISTELNRLILALEEQLREIKIDDKDQKDERVDNN